MKTKIAGLAVGTVLMAAAVWAEPEDVRFHGGSYDGWDRCTMTNGIGLGGPVVWLSSGTDQLFDFSQTPALASLTIAAEDPLDTITIGVTMHVSVPAAWRCRFDAASVPSYAGNASGKVGAATLSGDGRTLSIPVTTAFVATDTLTISGLKLVDLSLVPADTSRLELDYTGDGTRDLYDLYTVQVRVQWPGGSYDGWDRCATADYTSLAYLAGSVFKLR